MRIFLCRSMIIADVVLLLKTAYEGNFCVCAPLVVKRMKLGGMTSLDVLYRCGGCSGEGRISEALEVMA